MVKFAIRLAVVHSSFGCRLLNKAEIIIMIIYIILTPRGGSPTNLLDIVCLATQTLIMVLA